MAKSKKRIDRDPAQLSLFDIISQLKTNSSSPAAASPGSFNIDLRLREELSLGLKQSPLSRYQIAARMSELLGREITKSQLDSWTAESKPNHHLPVVYLPAFMEATGYREPIKLMAEMVHCYVIESKDALLTQLGKIKHEKKQLAEQEKTIHQFLKEMGK